MTKKQTIKKYFNQTEKLSLKNSKYKKQVKWLVDFMLNEDLDIKGDITTDTVIKNNPKVTAIVVAKESGVLAGLEEIILFSSLHTTHVTRHRRDGERLSEGDIILKISGGIKDILKIERTILNILQRMSGIATQTSKLVKKDGPLLCPTRKTQWGLLDKKAVTLGGGGTHRLGLYDWILIKDNHIKCTNYEQLTNIRTTKFFEIECKNEKQVFKFAKLNPGAIMLDNIKPKQITKIVEKLNKHYPKIIIEASGGINEANIKEYQKTGVDVISLGSLTHSNRALDISLDIK